MTTEGYGYDFAAFDAVTKPLLDKAVEKFGKHSYANWYPFKSPAGVWMAFHMPSYSDIRIINLDAMEVIVDGDFYSHLARSADGKADYRSSETVYASHTNASVYVPAFVESTYTTHEGKPGLIAMNDHELEGDELLDNVRSVPLAFNAWTIWAADYEFYVDVIDLSEVDSGKVHLLDLGEARRGMSIPIGASHIRNFVKPSTEHWYRMADKEKGIEGGTVENATFDAQILTEQHLGRLGLGKSRGFHDIYGEKGSEYARKDAPWRGLRDRLAALKPAAA